MTEENRAEGSLNTVTALVGLHAIERAMAEAGPQTELCGGDDILYYPRLSIRNNARAIRMVLPQTGQEQFWELLKVTGLRASAWNVTSFKGRPGSQRLWGLVVGLMKHTPTMLAIEPMSGMDARDRAHFSELIRCCGEKGISFTYTAVQLKDVMELGVPQRLRLAAPEGWLDTNTLRMEEAMEQSEDKSWNKLQSGWEGSDYAV